MRTQEEVLRQFDAWARANERVRAAVLTSTRADPERETDFLSDYDIELFVADLEPFRRDDGWLDAFGPVMARWPFRPRATCREDGITRLVLFEDGVRIDFQVLPASVLAEDAYDDDYSILIDKDGLTPNLGPPVPSMHLVRKPTEEEYAALVYDFWWDAHYVPKYLWRDELPFAAGMLGQAVRDRYLKTVIDWQIGLRHGWSVNTGVLGARFKRYLDGETWLEYESTFAGAGIEENWQAFFDAVALFARLARAVGEGLGYTYPSRIERQMTEYFRRIRSTKKAAEEGR